MAATLSSFSWAISILSKLTSALDLTTSEDRLEKTYPYTFTDGAGANQADVVWHDQRTLTASATEDLDLAGGLTDAFGNAITFVRIKAILVRAATGNTNSVLVGGAGANGFVNWINANTSYIAVHTGGIFVLISPTAAGYGVTASTGDLLRLANSGGGTSVTYDIVIVGSLT